MNIGGGDGYDGRARTSDSAPEGGPTATRTRLPDGDTGGRPPTRPGRSLVTVVAVIVLLIAAIAFANRGGGGGDDDSATGDNRSGSAPRADSTAPSGEKPVKNKEAGIPSGFPHSRQGAQSAAANYAVTLVSNDIFNAQRRGEIIERIFTPDKVAETKRQMDRAYTPALLSKMGLDEDGNAKKGTKYVSRTAPMGTKVRKYSDGAAQLDVWCTGVFGNAGKKSTNPVASDWFTLHLDLRWVEGDWRVEKFTQKEGPAPVNGDNRISGAEEISDAVDEFGGFTYAR
ncbi:MULTISPECIES: hypothetical protein [Streptomyces]|uniref:DUF8175 domain-containing protein n=1 Tax=Streptomyces albus TaxID=1888 RepID=A0A8H1QTR6_9ACTN|nr:MULTISPECIES: hypothetical protein [Streptomyces]KPC68339.1 membrane protein [Streptomyces sp. NRRL F-6602]TGG87416.1 hypothetical protein D8771_04575 [Streptomyces albus]UVN56028.1 hypothetical protein NR995_17020 [Streptomyces albus]